MAAPPSRGAEPRTAAPRRPPDGRSRALRITTSRIVTPAVGSPTQQRTTAIFRDDSRAVAARIPTRSRRKRSRKSATSTYMSYDPPAMRSSSLASLLLARLRAPRAPGQRPQATRQSAAPAGRPPPCVRLLTLSPAAAPWSRCALSQRGFRLGTDGTGRRAPRLPRRQRPAWCSPGQARPATWCSSIWRRRCQDHVGLAESVDPDGRITFREVRDGQVRTSYVHAAEPCARRDGQGRILNTFLRPKRPDDPPATRYFAARCCARCCASSAGSAISPS
jgi:hypothetical protein